MLVVFRNRVLRSGVLVTFERVEGVGEGRWNGRIWDCLGDEYGEEED